MEVDIELTDNQKKEAIKRLKGVSFDNIKIDKHYNNKFGLPRHGVSLETSKQIYNEFNKIVTVTYRESSFGRKYCFFYKINKKKSYKLLFFLDKNPIILFNAMSIGKNVEQRLFRKFGFNR